MPTFTELLPPTKSEKHGVITWVSAVESAASAAGALTISGKRGHCEYRLSEFRTDFDGRAFELTKADRSATYSVFVGRAGGSLCECLGFQSSGRCKHIAACETLVRGGQI